MLFRKDIEPRCAYCKRGNAVNDREVVCKRKGIVQVEGHCPAFRYDPMKRVPPRPVKLDTRNLKKEDFEL